MAEPWLDQALKDLAYRSSKRIRVFMQLLNIENITLSSKQFSGMRDPLDVLVFSDIFNGTRFNLT